MLLIRELDITRLEMIFSVGWYLVFLSNYPL